MKILVDLVTAFTIGGAFCVIAQLLIDLTKLTPARILVLYVSVGVFLGAVGLYSPLLSFAGCGASVPLIGFGGLVAKGVREAIDKDGAIGILSGGITAASAGITASLLLGYLVAVFFRGGPKKM
jgi:stage V sporulation protein AE